MRLGKVRIALGILAALTTVVAAGEAVRSSGGASTPTQLTPLALPPSSTSRPPAVPVELGLLAAGHTHLPMRRTPLHHWHEAAGAQWLDAESQIRAAGATMSQQEQQALAAKSGPAIAAALNQEVAALTAQDQRLAALPWPSSMKADIDSFESSSAAALDQLRSAASNPFGYDATQINAAIAAFNTAANNVRHDLGLPPG